VVSRYRGKVKKKNFFGGGDPQMSSAITCTLTTNRNYAYIKDDMPTTPTYPPPVFL
jgi:hypothetical protein